MATKSQSALPSPDCRSHFIQTSRLTSTWTTRATRRFRCPSDKNLQISKKINLGLRFFWKVIVDGKSKRGIAMLGSNNPHAAQTPPCTAIAQEVSWLRWWGIFLLFQATQVLYQHHPPQLCEHSGDGGGAFDRLLCWGFLSSCSRVPGGSRHLRRASHMRWR